MNTKYPNITVSGLNSLQQFVPVQSGTGILVSSGSVRVTGEQAQASVMELRESPVGSSMPIDTGLSRS